MTAVYLDSCGYSASEAGLEVAVEPECKTNTDGVLGVLLAPKTSYCGCQTRRARRGIASICRAGLLHYQQIRITP